MFKPVKKELFLQNVTSRQLMLQFHKKNLKRKDIIDAHYMLTRIKMGKELTAYVRDECTVVSAGLMNKTRYGTIALSPYHQICK